jgi:hypothetical protein
MNESLTRMNQLLREVAAHLQAGTATDRNAAVAKLQQIATEATTLAVTVKLKN